MKKTLFIAFLITLSTTFILAGCVSDTSEDAALGEQEIIEDADVPTEKEQIEQSLSDQEAYQKAKETGKASYCEDIEFHAFKEKCEKLFETSN